MYQAADSRYDAMTYRRTAAAACSCRRSRSACGTTSGTRPPLEHAARGPAPGLRPRHHALRPGQQLRPAVRLRRGELRPAARAATCGRTATSSSSPPRPATTCGPGPYGDGGSRKYLLSSLDQSLARLGLDYVDIFYSHRPDPSVPLEETMGALHTAVTSGKALYAGISNYSPAQTRVAQQVLADLGTPLLIHQPSLLDVQPAGSPTADETCSTSSASSASGPSCSPRWRRACSPTATSRAMPADSRAAAGTSSSPSSSRRRTCPAPGAERDRGGSRPVARAARPVLGAPRRPHHVRADRRELGRAARGQRRRAVRPAADRRRDRRDRAPRGRRHGPLAARTARAGRPPARRGRRAASQ